MCLYVYYLLTLGGFGHFCLLFFLAQFFSLFFLGFPGGLVSEESACSAGDTGDKCSIPGLERSPGGGYGNPLQYSCWRLPWTEEPGGLQSLGLKGSDTTEATEHSAPSGTLSLSL